MNLSDTFQQLVNYLNLRAHDVHFAEGAETQLQSLIAFAAEDQQGGRNAGYDGWSIDPEEGKVLYALARLLQPQQVLEIGVRQGASTAHLLAALDANGSGKLDSYDVEPSRESVLSDRWTFHQGDALAADFPRAGLVFEDGAHGLDFSRTLYERLKPLAGVIVVHDYAMTPAHGDFFVKPAFDEAFPDGLALSLDGCERGLAVWINPNWQPEAHEAPRKPAAKRARK